MFTIILSTEVGHEFDYLFIQFYNNYCYPGDQYFLPVMDTWLKWTNSIQGGPRILLGLPAGTKAAGKDFYYFPPDKLAAVYKVGRNSRYLGEISSIVSVFSYLIRRS